jgi:periplasmic mercuric ion binding protein
VTKLLTASVLGLGLLASSSAFAAERTITLAVRNMYCTDCPFIVAKGLQAVPGVTNVMVSFRTKMATVTYEDGKADVRGLTAATTNAGYPSAPKG